MIVCDLYCRVSSAEQAEEGYSLQEQETRLRAYAQAQGWTVNACYVDPGFSGAKLDRPGIQAVIRDAQLHRIDRVVTYKLDRLSRSQKDTIYLIEDVFKKNNVGYVSMTESFDTSTPLGMAMIGILSVFAQLEREQISERMMMGRIASAKEGNWRGGSGVPLGYRYIPKTPTEEGRLVVDEYEARIVREIFEQFLAGKTYHAIYDYCREKYATETGRFGHGGSSGIPMILRNRTYIGEIKYCGEWYPGKHEPILPLELFNRVQAAMVEYKESLDQHRRKPYKVDHLLTGFLYCGECGARWCYHSCSYKNRLGEKVVYGTYTCYTKNAHKQQRRADRCSIPVWNAAELEALVLENVRAFNFEDLEEQTRDGSFEVEAYEKKIKQIDNKMQKAIDLYLEGIISVENVKRRNEELTREREQLVLLKEAAESRIGRLSAHEIRSAMERVDEILAGPEDGIRDLLALLVRRIILLPNKEIRIEWNL